MVEPYIGEIRMFGFNFPPAGWAFCEGQSLSIEQNQALFSILGNRYGGDGRVSFNLPDLRGRTPVHVGNGISLGESLGEEAPSLTVDEIPAHTHTMRGSSDTAATGSGGTNASGNVWANATISVYHAAGGTTVQMNAGVVGNAGSGVGRDNMQPFVTVRFCIALTGTFPPRN